MKDPMDTRAAVELVDVILGLGVLVAIIALAPVMYHFIDMVSGVADPFTSLVLQLTIPTLIIGLIISMGVSAKRGV